MTNATTVFLPWVRQGLAARIATPDPLVAPLPANAAVKVTVDVNGTELAAMQVRVNGPGDVIGIDPRQVVRMEPPPATTNFESNDLAAVEFDSPELPWLFTPAGATAQGQLRPWLCLVVVRKQDGVRLRAPRDELLPVLEIGAPALPADEVPDLADSWAWAHAQVSTQADAGEQDLRTLLATRPELSVARLVCPRLLAPFTDYIACVVPAFEAGRRAGLNQPLTAAHEASLTPAWTSGAQSPSVVTLPVYFQWEFRTGEREDFESLVARLQPRDLTGSVGRRPMDINQPGFAHGTQNLPTIEIEGALQPIDAHRAAWPDAAAQPWQQTLASILNSANARSADPNADPIVGAPIYGRWYAERHTVGDASTRTWLDEVNLDPRERIVAGLGTRVIQEHQEDLMAEAWQQAGEIDRVNQRLRQMQLSLAITTSLHTRHVARMTDDDALWRLAGPAQPRLLWKAATAQSPAMTMRTVLATSTTPVVTTSAAMRRLARPRGAVSRRAAAAVRAAGVTAVVTVAKPTKKATAGSRTRTAAAAATATATAAGTTATTLRTGSMFRLFTAEAAVMILMLPPTRSLVSFDAVTRRLPAQHAGIVWAKATDAAVAGAPARPTFQVAAPLSILSTIDLHLATTGILQPSPAPTPTPTVGIVREAIVAPTTGVTKKSTKKTKTTAKATRATTTGAALRRAGDDIEIPDDPAPTRPPIERPPVERPPRGGDSADAAAFRAAASRHLARVNPQRPLIVFAQLAVLEASAMRLQVQTLLDPAPTMLLRMAASIQITSGTAAGVTAPPERIATVGLAPTYTQSMSEPLSALSQDWLLPGLERVPPDTVALLEPNPRFIEAFMLGLNVEMGRELVWRDFPIADERATYFQRFWRAANPASQGDVAPLAQWGEHKLGANAAAGVPAKQVVLLVRSTLLRRYPTAMVYAVPAVRTSTQRKPGAAGDERHPLFRGTLEPDVSFFGFDIDPDDAVGDPGWYFVIAQQPTEPRFGFDVEIDFADASHVPLGAPPAGLEIPAGAQWARNAAHMAQVTRQQPVRVAIHASELIRATPPTPPPT